MNSWDEGLDISALLHDAADLAAAMLHDASTGAVTRPLPPQLLSAFRRAPAPAGGRPASEILAAVRDEIAPYPMGNGHPRFMAWVNSPPHPVGVAAALLAAALNPSVAGGRHAAVHVEHAVVRWFLDLAGWGSSPGGGDGYGLFVSGGSAATTTALASARHRAYARAGWNDRENGVGGAPQPVVFATAEAHSCMTKAVELLGIGSANVVTVAVGLGHRMCPGDLAAQIGAARAAGRVPVAVVASAGTVNTGAIDPLAEIAGICREHGIWLHVDGAYGAPAVLLLDELDSVRTGLSLADSIALDPHKWLYAPVDAGLLLFRDGDAPRSMFSLVPSYLAAGHNDDEPPWFAEYGSEQTRPFRALKLWMQLQYLGLDGYRELISRDLAAARALRSALEQADDFDVLAHGLSVVCFRQHPRSLNDDGLDRHNRAIAERLQRDGRAFLAATTVDGVTALRACIVDPRTGPEDIAAVLDAVRDAARPIAGAPGRRRGPRPDR